LSQNWNPNVVLSSTWWGPGVWTVASYKASKPITANPVVNVNVVITSRCFYLAKYHMSHEAKNPKPDFTIHLLYPVDGYLPTTSHVSWLNLPKNHI
jgi:hypothetical protein